MNDQLAEGHAQPPRGGERSQTEIVSLAVEAASLLGAGLDRRPTQNRRR